MKIISHRGYWIEPREKNTLHAFRRSFDLGFGTETDIRDLDSQIVISHDMPKKADAPLSFENFLEVYVSYEGSIPLALNIKADGIQDEAMRLLNNFSVNEFVFFDMSVPDAVLTAKKGYPFLARRSDLEPHDYLFESCKGFWLDEFENAWIDRSFIETYSSAGKDIYVVSPELHGNEHIARWTQYREMGLSDFDNVTLCTDMPENAKLFLLGDEND